MNRALYLFAFTSLALVTAGYLLSTQPVADPTLANVMFEAIWLPTVGISLLIGALLASSGTLIQVSLDNDFASPSTLGIGSGALLGAVLARVFIPEAGLAVIWFAALSGSLLISLLVLSVSKLIGGGQLPVVLIGMAIGLGAGALASLLLLFFEHETDGLFIWGSGQVLQSSAEPLKQITTPALLMLLISAIILPKLAIFQLGEQQAHGLGVAVSRWRRIILFIAIAQAALATAVAGMIGFIGLMAPHIARYLNAKRGQSEGVGHQWLLSLTIGAALVLLAEWVSRSMLFLGYRIPTGAFAALLGAPFFIALLFGKRGRALAATESQVVGLRPWVALPPKFIVLLLSGGVVVTVLAWRLPAGEYGAAWVDQRILLAGLAGFALATGGVLLQTLFRNPLASPDISGVSTSAVFFIACLLVMYPGASQTWITLVSLLGAIIVIALLFWGLRLSLSVSQLALFGIVISAFTGTATHILLTFGSTTSSITLMWLSGSTYGVSVASMLPLAVALVLSAIVILPQLRQLDILPLGEITPRTLGMSLTPVRVVLLGVAALLTSVAVSSVGAISFVGLLAPHCARLLGLHRHCYLLPAAGLTGAMLLISADGIGRSVISPSEVPAGLVVSVLGSLYFLLLLLVGYRKQHYGTS